MQRAKSHFVDALADPGPEGLDTRLTQHMAAGEDVLWDLAHAAEACRVARELCRAAQLGEVSLDFLPVQSRDQLPFRAVGPVLLQLLNELLEMVGNFFHPILEEGLGGELWDVGTFGEDLAGAGLVALFVGILDITTKVTTRLEAAAEPFVAEIIKGCLDGCVKGVPKQGLIGTCQGVRGG